MTTAKQVILGGAANYTAENYTILLDLLAAGKLQSIIDRRYPLDQIVQAHRYVDQGHKKGSVIITVD